MSLAIPRGYRPPDTRAAQIVDIHVSYGQSWRVNAYDTLGSPFGFNYQPGTLYALHLPTRGAPDPHPGPASNGIGISLPSLPDGLTPYVPNDAVSDDITIGRCAVLAQQYLRLRSGQTSLAPILEYCTGWPGSTWTTGGGGGLQPSGQSWQHMLQIMAATPAIFPWQNIADFHYRSMGYTQGGAADNTLAGKLADLTAMIDAYDGLDLPGPPQNYYIGLPAAISTATVGSPTNQGSAVFCRDNQPLGSGPYSGRVFATAPSYPWKFTGADNIHTGNYGSARWGEFEGYVQYAVEDRNLAWTPLWRSLSRPITVSGQNITVPFDLAAGTDFGPLSWKSEAEDGLKIWPDNGFAVHRSAVALTFAGINISADNVVLTVNEPLSPADALEVSYAWYGPGGPNPSVYPGVGGNLCQVGPPSDLFPGNTINCWAWPFVETVTI